MDDSLLDSVYLSDKVVLVGDAGVGKTSIFRAFCGESINNGAPTGEYRKKWKTIDGKLVAMSLFDTPGCMFGTPGHTPPSFFKGDKGVLLVYSVTDLESFLSISSWLNEVLSRSRGSGPVIGLVGNKIDLQSNKTVTVEQAKEFASQNFIPEDLIFHISAKSGTNIQEMFDRVASKLDSNSKNATAQSTVKVNKTSKSKCC